MQSSAEHVGACTPKAHGPCGQRQTRVPIRPLSSTQDAPIVSRLAAALGAGSQPPLCRVVDRVEAQDVALGAAVGVRPAGDLWQGGWGAGRCPASLHLVWPSVARAAGGAGACWRWCAEWLSQAAARRRQCRQHPPCRMSAGTFITDAPLSQITTGALDSKPKQVPPPQLSDHLPRTDTHAAKILGRAKQQNHAGCNRLLAQAEFRQGGGWSLWWLGLPQFSGSMVAIWGAAGLDLSLRAW